MEKALIIIDLQKGFITEFTWKLPQAALKIIKDNIGSIK